MSNSPILIDVRSKVEYDEYHLEGAIHIPYYEISNIQYPLDTQILLYCNSGRRAKIAKKALDDLGYKSVKIINSYTISDLK